MSQLLHVRVLQLVTGCSVSLNLASRLHLRTFRGILRLHVMAMINSGVRQAITEND